MNTEQMQDLIKKLRKHHHDKSKASMQGDGVAAAEQLVKLQARVEELEGLAQAADKLREDFGESLDTYQGGALEAYDTKREAIQGLPS